MWGGKNRLRKIHRFPQKMLQLKMEVLERAAKEPSCICEMSSLTRRILCMDLLFVEDCCNVC